MKKIYENVYVIVRTEKAGVFAGNAIRRDGDELLLHNARRIWYWDGARSLSQLAVDGTKEPKNCKFAMEVASIELFGVIEIIPCTEKAEKSIKDVAVWKI